MGIRQRLFNISFPDSVAGYAARTLGGSKGVILMYHEVLNADAGVPAWTVVKADQFLQQMLFLKKNFEVIHLPDLLSRVKNSAKHQKPYAVITFDDGYAGNFNTVLPIMEELQLPFAVYVATRPLVDGNLFWYDLVINSLSVKSDLRLSVGNGARKSTFVIAAQDSDMKRWKVMQSLLTMLKTMQDEERTYWASKLMAESRAEHLALRMMNTSELKRLAASKLVTVGGHTHGHELLDQLSIDAVRQTLDISEEILREHLGDQGLQSHFAYPNGNFNAEIVNELQSRGYLTAVTTKPGLVEQGTPTLALPRVGIGRFDSMNQFKAKVTGFIS